MEGWKDKYLYHLIRAVVLMHDLVLLRKTIEKEKQFPDVRATLVAIYNIYSSDPDLVGIYYNTQNRLKTGAYRNKAEEEALKVLFRVAEEIIRKADLAATK